MLWERRRRKGSEEACFSTLEPTVGLDQEMQDTLESLKEPLSPFQAERADVGSRGHRHQARSLRGPRRAPVPPSPSRASSSSPGPHRTRSEFFLTQWGKLFPGLLKLKGTVFDSQGCHSGPGIRQSCIRGGQPSLPSPRMWPGWRNLPASHE